MEHFEVEKFLNKFQSDKAKDFEDYLDTLTSLAEGMPGYRWKKRKNLPEVPAFYPKSMVSWGTARKCINLCIRNFVYNAFIWQYYNLGDRGFKKREHLAKLEIPLDSFSFKRLKEKATKEERVLYKEHLKSFTILGLNEGKSEKLQHLATAVAGRMGVCRIHLDVEFWRSDDEQKFDDYT